MTGKWYTYHYKNGDLRDGLSLVYLRSWSYMGNSCFDLQSGFVFWPQKHWQKMVVYAVFVDMMGLFVYYFMGLIVPINMNAASQVRSSR